MLRTPTVVLSLLCSILLSSANLGTLRAADPQVPNDVAAFSKRVDACIASTGQEGIDAKEIQKIDRAIQKNCSDLKQEAPRLRAKYYGNPAVTQELTKILSKYQAAFAEAI